MSTRLPVKINPYRLIEQKRSLGGSLALKNMPRLLELILSDKGSVDVALNFMLTETGLPLIKGNIKTNLKMQCQRCLQAVDIAITSQLKVVLIKTDTEAEVLQEGFDTWLVKNESIFLQDFVEDEILLNLPYIAKHEKCELAKELSETFSVQVEVEEVERKDNPFTVLNNWKTK